MGTTLSELFEKNPMELTRAQRDQIVSALRERRALWLTERANAKSAGRKPRLSENATSAKLRGLDLGDLDLSGMDEILKNK